MRVIIAGSRTITDRSLLERAIAESGFNITEIVEGAARGVDTMGFDYGWANKIPVRAIPANWKKHGRAAGVRRNIEMAEYADALIAIWDGVSRGTMNMIDEAKKRGLKVFVYSIKDKGF